jgi:hypothetical protein
MVKLNLNLTKEQKNVTKDVITRVPRNEEEVKRIFFKLENVLGFTDVRLYTSFPDATAFYEGKEIEIEFETHSSNFKNHRHKEEDCDLIVCWEDDDSSLKVQVLELATLAEDWLKAREKLIMKYAGLLMQIAERNGVEDKNISKQMEGIECLKEKYDFDRDDALKGWTGLSESGVRYYDKLLNLHFPECVGGPLKCEKRDIDPKYLDIKPSSQKLVPISLCKDCQNKVKCRLGKEKVIGYYFLLSFDKKRPRKVCIQRRQIKNEKILPYMKQANLNLWEAIEFKRR